MADQRKSARRPDPGSGASSRGGKSAGKNAANKTGKNSANKTGRNGRPKRSLGRRILNWGLLAVLVCIILGAAAFAYGYTSTDIPDPNKDFQAQTSFVYYADGKTEIGRFAIQNRVSIPLADVPQHVQDAVIAAEDRSFRTNKGIDPKGILRAAFSNARGNSTQGASTITQQYVKVLYLSQQRTLSRKIKEAFLSLKIQNQMSKQEVLQGYLNTIYFGRGAYGIQAAAQAYFNVDAKDLNLRQGAVLAAVLNSPGSLDPAQGHEAEQRLLGRYQYVLSGMASMGSITKEQAAQAGQRLPDFPKIQSKDQYAGQRGYMMDMVKKQLRKEGFSDSEIEGGGLRVTSTFDRSAMRAAAKAVHQERPRGLKKLHVAVASVDPRTGALRGMFAGQDYLKSNGGTNWAVAGGSPGSAFKPFALSAALKDGYSLKSTFDGNSPYVFPNGNKVVNEGPGGGHDYGSRISLLTATEQSVNTAYVDLTMSMKNGPQKILNTAVDMGIPKDAPGLTANPVISLGSVTLSPIDMANSYGTIANTGETHHWFLISSVKSASGQSLFTQRVEPHRALPKDIDSDVSYALQQVVKHGTGQNALALGRPAAGKTGTATNAHGDVSSSWFVGYTPQLSTAVMYVRGDGNDALNGYMPSYFGADYPTRTWTAVMKRALAGKPVLSFPPPAFVAARHKQHAPLPTYTPPTQTVAPTPTYTPPPPVTSAPPSHTATPKPTPSPTPTPTPTPSPSPTPTPTPSLSPSPQVKLSPSPPGLGCGPGCPTKSPGPPGGGNGTGGGGNGGGTGGGSGGPAPKEHAH